MSADEQTVYWLSLAGASAATLLRRRALEAGLEWRRGCDVSKVTVEPSLHPANAMPAASTELPKQSSIRCRPNVRHDVPVFCKTNLN